MVFVKIALEIRYLTSILQRNSHEWVFIFRGSCTLRVLLVFNLSFPSCPFLSFCLDISQTKPKTLSPSLPPCHPSLLSSLDPNGVVLCAVCKDQITLNAQAKQLPCQHLYHSDCITPWIELNSSCPLCRFRLEEEEEEGGDADADADAVMTEIRREIIARLTELTEEDFYGLRTTLSHIASRHALIEENQNHRAQIGEPRGGGGGGGGDSAC